MFSVNTECRNLELAGDYTEVTPVFFKSNILQAIKNLFGEVTASVDVDVLKYNIETNRGLLRVPKTEYIKVRNSLTLYSKTLEQVHCAFRVHKASSLLLALQGSDCYDLFKNMQNCMQKYPTLYNKDLADDDEISNMAAAESQAQMSIPESTNTSEASKKDDK
ncbi:unnamed protein product [Brassicogethes aeneus]|uniref:Uncharacterized protein n=1 Tax=Brassicogethes aeneus TaxID=1431903 RepID=A0A9P0AW48_BRAAE|nr:unnamed protein product [Brassicogethes aeneus]